MFRLTKLKVFSNHMILLFAFIAAIAVGVLISNGESKLVLLAVIAGLTGLMSLIRPEFSGYIPLAAIVVTNTFPPLIYGDWLSIGTQGAHVRPDFVLLLMGLFLVYDRSRRGQQRIRTPLDTSIGVLLVIALTADLISVTRGHLVGIGPMIRFAEGWIWFFIASRLTRREDIPRLVTILVIVVSIFAGALLAVSLTGSQLFYTQLFTFTNVQESINYAQFFTGYERPRVWLMEGETLIQQVWVLGLASTFNSGLSFVWGGILLLIGLRSVSSLGRNFIGWLVIYFIATACVFLRAKRNLRWRTIFISLAIIGVFALSLYILVSKTEVWSNVVYWLGVRTFPTLEQLPNTYIGARWAWSKMMRNPLFLVLGAGAFAPKPFDINLPFVEIVFSLGIAGFLAYIWLFRKGLKQTWQLFNSTAIREVERPVVAMALVTCLMLLGGLIVNIRPTTYVAHPLTTVPLAILLGWVQVIHGGVVGVSSAREKVE